MERLIIGANSIIGNSELFSRLVDRNANAFFLTPNLNFYRFITRGRRATILQIPPHLSLGQTLIFRLNNSLCFGVSRDYPGGDIFTNLLLHFSFHDTFIHRDDRCLISLTRLRDDDKFLAFELLGDGNTWLGARFIEYYMEGGNLRVRELENLEFNIFSHLLRDQCRVNMTPRGLDKLLSFDSSGFGKYIPDDFNAGEISRIDLFSEFDDRKRGESDGRKTLNLSGEYEDIVRSEGLLGDVYDKKGLGGGTMEQPGPAEEAGEPQVTHTYFPQPRPWKNFTLSPDEQFLGTLFPINSDEVCDIGGDIGEMNRNIDETMEFYFQKKHMEPPYFSWQVKS